MLRIKQPRVTGSACYEHLDQKLKLGKHENNKDINVVLGNFMGKMDSLRAFVSVLQA